jgi:hypothetical protein
VRSADAWTSCLRRRQLHPLTETHRIEEPQPHPDWGSVDDTGGWGHLNVVHIVMSDSQAQRVRRRRRRAWEGADVVVERYERQGDHCPLGSLFLQVGRSRPGARATVTELMRQWQEQLALGMRTLQTNGLVSPALDVDRTAAALLAGIQGGVAIMMSTDDSTHLKAALDSGIEYLRATASEPTARKPAHKPVRS